MLLQPLQGHAVAVFHVPILRTSSATTAFLWAPDPPAFAPRSTLAATGGNAASAAAVLRPPGTRWPPHHQKLPQGLLATPSSHPSRATPAQRARWCSLPLGGLCQQGQRSPPPAGTPPLLEAYPRRDPYPAHRSPPDHAGKRCGPWFPWPASG